MRYEDYIAKKCVWKCIPGKGRFGTGTAVISEESRSLVKSLIGEEVTSSLGHGKIESVNEETGDVMVRFDNDWTKFMI